MFLRPELIFQWESLLFWFQAYWKLILQWKCLFFGFRHCGRRCCALFYIWIYSVFKTRIVFSMRVLVFLVQAYWKWIFQWEPLFFSSQAYWKWFCQWKSLFFLMRPIENDCFSMRVFVFWFQGYWTWICNESVCVASRMFDDGAVPFFIWTKSVLETRLVFSTRVFVFWSQAYWKLIL